MYSTKLFNKKSTAFEPIKGKGGKEEKKFEEVPIKEGKVVDEKNPDIMNGRYKGKQIFSQPALKGQLTGYFGFPSKETEVAPKDADKEFRDKFRIRQSNYFKHKEDEFKGAPSLIAQTKLEKSDKNRRFKPEKLEAKEGMLNFGSNDVHKSDEFCNGIRQAQWKELLNTESRFQTQWANKAAETRGLDLDKSAELSSPVNRLNRSREINLEREAKGLPAHFQTEVPIKLYDVGKVSETPICYKCSRQTFYCKHRVGIVTARRPGGSEYRTMNQEIGGRVWGISSKPTHGRVAVTKQFSDISHLAV